MAGTTDVAMEEAPQELEKAAPKPDVPEDREEEELDASNEEEPTTGTAVLSEEEEHGGQSNEVATGSADATMEDAEPPQPDGAVQVGATVGPAYGNGGSSAGEGAAAHLYLMVLFKWGLRWARHMAMEAAVLAKVLRPTST